MTVVGNNAPRKISNVLRRAGACVAALKIAGSGTLVRM